MSSTKIAEMIVDKITNFVDSQGLLPWQKDWVSLGIGDSCANYNFFNVLKKNDPKPYRGWNFWMTNMTLLERGYNIPLWVTFKQAKQLGGSVKKGEKSTPIIFWSIYRKDVEDKETGEVKNKKFFVLKYYNVFNVAQCEGLPEVPSEYILEPKDEDELDETKKIEVCESIVKGYKDCPQINYGGDRAYYSHADFIQMPKMEQFNTSEGFYSTLFHEMIHSTGAKKRLNRPNFEKHSGFGSKDYSKEELVAELGSAMLCAETGISPAVIENQASYIKSWLKVLNNNKEWIISASSQAEKASAYIMRGEKPEYEGEGE
jgi:antirestriction protein ArdC